MLLFQIIFICGTVDSLSCTEHYACVLDIPILTVYLLEMDMGEGHERSHES